MFESYSIAHRIDKALNDFAAKAQRECAHA